MELRSQVKDAELSQVSRGAAGRCAGEKHVQAFVAELRPGTGAEGGYRGEQLGGGLGGSWHRPGGDSGGLSSGEAEGMEGSSGGFEGHPGS